MYGAVTAIRAHTSNMTKQSILDAMKMIFEETDDLDFLNALLIIAEESQHNLERFKFGDITIFCRHGKMDSYEFCAYQQRRSLQSPRKKNLHKNQ